LHALAAAAIQSRKFSASTLLEQLFKLKDGDTIKKLRFHAKYIPAKAYPSTLCNANGSFQSHETVPLN
jgi:hypothetical protein